MIDISNLNNKTQNKGADESGRLAASEWNTLVSAVEELQDESYVKPTTGIPTTDITDANLSMTQAEINQGVDAALASKQAALVSGTNIKTINGQSVLGSGDVIIQSGDTDAVKFVQQSLSTDQKAQARTNIGAQEALISGSTIKTVNNQSLLGSGDITVQGGQDGEDGVGFDSITTPSTPDGTTQITLTNGDTITLDLNHQHQQYPKYVYCATQAAYDAITTKESDTIYLILED